MKWEIRLDQIGVDHGDDGFIWDLTNSISFSCWKSAGHLERLPCLLRGHRLWHTSKQSGLASIVYSHSHWIINKSYSGDDDQWISDVMILWYDMAGRKVADMRHDYELWPKIMTHDIYDIMMDDSVRSCAGMWAASWSGFPRRSLGQRKRGDWVRGWRAKDIGCASCFSFMAGSMVCSKSVELHVTCCVKSSVVCSVVPVGQTVNHHPCYTYTYTVFFCSQWKSDLDCQGSRSQQDGWEYDFHQCDWILDRSLTCQCLGYWAAILWSVDMGHGNIAKPGTLSLGGIYQCDNHSVIVRVRT